MSSKKMLRLIIAMAVLLVLAVGGYFLVDFIKQKQEDAELAEKASYQMYSFNDSMINRVTFETEEGNFKTEVVSGMWALTETDYPYDLELDPYYVNVVVSYMSTLKAIQKFDVAPDRLEAYGLNEPTVVTCYAGSTAYTLYVGNPSATEECYYVMLPDDDTVYGIDFDIGRVLHGGTYYLRNREMIPFHETEITGFSLVHGKDSLILEKPDGMWLMKAPLPDGNVNSATVTSMLTAVTRLEIDNFITADPDADRSAYGLDKPEYVVTVNTADKTCTLWFVSDPEKDGYMNVLRLENSLISSVSTSMTGFLNTQANELMSDMLLSINFGDAAELDAMVDYDTHFTMTLDHENGSYLFDETDVAEISDNATATYRNLFDTIAKIKYESMDLDANIPEDAEPACEFAFTLTDGTKTVLTLIPTKDENLYWAMIDGKYTGLTVRRRTLTGNTGVLDFYERMTDIIKNQ